MTQIRRKLDEISTRYAIFEHDQVLTATQLNTLSDYFEDQTRLSRTQLLGVGIVCGLQVAFNGKEITVDKGSGITTDGDLLFYPGKVQFTHYKLYTDVDYPPFLLNGKMIPAYELVAPGESNQRAFQLTRFAELTKQKPEQMLALLFMESSIYDPDQCAGVDCNNAGQEMVNKMKVLLLSREYLDRLLPKVQTPHRAYGQLEEVTVDRPVINAATVKTHAQLVSVYRGVCNAIHAKLAAQLPRIYATCSAFLSDGYPADPSASWITILNNWKNHYAGNEFGVQYYYDFLCDLAETYNKFCDLLFGDNTWCSPDKDAFPKHLLLGALGGDSENEVSRTPFFPSCQLSHTLEQKRHAIFLFEKLNAMLLTFEVPAVTRRVGMEVHLNRLENIPPAEMVKPSNLWLLTKTTNIRITPGRSDLYNLEKRAIPYYFRADAAHPIHEYWNFRLHRRKKAAYNYAYRADQFGAKGAAAAPFAFQTGKCDFYRIEGCLGQNIADAHRFLEAEINSKNLPIHLRSVMLGEDRKKIVIRPPFSFGHLHHLHNLMRQDIVNQLDEVKQFSSGLKSRLLNKLELLDPADKGTFSQVADRRSGDLNAAADRATAKLKLPYQEYAAQNTATDSWQHHLGEAMQQSGNFKSEISIAAKTEFNTPLDSLVSNRNVDLLDHLDILINREVETKENRLLFGNYLTSHPGLEHVGGAPRGGTFVLVYDETSTVIADFMLPYQEVDAEKNDLLEPDIAVRPFRPGFVIDAGLSIIEPVDNRIKGRLDDFRTKELNGILNTKTKELHDQLDGAWNTRFDTQQKDYFNSIKESFGNMSNALIKNVSARTTAGAATDITDLTLNKAVDEVRQVRDLYNSYKAKAEGSSDTAEKTRYSDLATGLEPILSEAITEATKVVGNSGAEIAPGSDGMKALTEIGAGISMLRNDTLRTSTIDRLDALSVASGSDSFKNYVKVITRR